MEAVKDPFSCIVMYIQVKHIIEKKKCRLETWFNPSVAVWMKADLNASLQLILRKGWGFMQTK